MSLLRAETIYVKYKRLEERLKSQIFWPDNVIMYIGGQY